MRGLSRSFYRMQEWYDDLTPEDDEEWGEDSEDEDEEDDEDKEDEDEDEDTDDRSKVL